MGSRLTGEAVVHANNICALMPSEEINTQRERERMGARSTREGTGLDRGGIY